MRKLPAIAMVCVLAAMSAAFWATSAGAQQATDPASARWAAPAADLAKQITALAGPGPATLSVENTSSITTEQVGAIRALLVADLRASGVGVRATAEGAAIPTAVRVTLSQSAKSGLWVAEVQQGTETRVAMTEVALETGSVAPAQATMTLRKERVFVSAERILDAQMIVNASPENVAPDLRLVVLTPQRIVIYARAAGAIQPAGAGQSAGAWQQVQSYAVNVETNASRDPRGELVQGVGGMNAYLPGAECDGTANADGKLAFICRAGDDPWPIGGPIGEPLGAQKAYYNASRNYFSGVLVLAFGGMLGPFYSAAELPRASGAVTIFSDVHGRVRMIDRGALVEVTGSRDWGSDVASVRTDCGTGTQVLVDTAGETTQDSLRAYEISGHEATAVSAALGLDGTVTALHTSSDGAAAMAVLRAGDQYEVWRVSLDCH